jgi:multidrug transporter EmrE-like cation transporter
MTPAAIGVALVVTSALIESVAEIFLKKSRIDLARQIRWLVLGISVFAVQFSVYTAALRYIDVGAAFSIASLSFAFVALLSKLLLGEAVTPIKWLGIALIVTGTSLIGAFA